MQFFNMPFLTEEPSIVEQAARTIPYAIIAQIIGTVIVFFVLVKYVYPIVVRVVNERQNYIESSLTDAEAQRKEAEEVKILVENEKKDIKLTRKNIIDEATNQAKIESRQIIERARSEAHNVLERANKEIESEEKNAQERLSRDTLELVTLVSEKFLTDNLNSEANQKLIDDALEVVKNAN